MKNIRLYVISILVLAGCVRSPLNSSNAKGKDLFTATENGVTFRDTVPSLPSREAYNPRPISSTDKRMSYDTGHGRVYVCTLHKSNDFAQFSIIYNLYKGVSLVILNAVGPAGGTGVFTSTKGISATDPRLKNITDLQPCSSYETYYSGGQHYTVDSAVVNVTKYDGKALEANYELWVSNNNVRKTVTGTINYNQE